MNAELSSFGTMAAEARRDSPWGDYSATEIALSMNIEADKRRVLLALTLPEYLETWISYPECRRGCMVRALRIACSYRIDFVYDGLLDASISGSFRMLQDDKLLLTWRRFGVCEDAQSVVNILLQGGGSTSLLELRHTGLPSKAEYEWHQKLWRASLRNLSQLFPSGLVSNLETA